MRSTLSRHKFRGLVGPGREDLYGLVLMALQNSLQLFFILSSSVFIQCGCYDWKSKFCSWAGLGLMFPGKTRGTFSSTCGQHHARRSV